MFVFVLDFWKLLSNDDVLGVYIVEAFVFFLDCFLLGQWRKFIIKCFSDIFKFRNGQLYSIELAFFEFRVELIVIEVEKLFDFSF